MSLVLESERITAPVRHQAESAQAVAIKQKVRRLREMRAFFESIPDRRVAAGLGPVQSDIRELVYEEQENGR